jgi:hypothetical protein
MLALAGDGIANFSIFDCRFDLRRIVVIENAG